MTKMLDYQQEAYEKIIGNFQTESRALVVMATGLGKTIIAGFYSKKRYEQKLRGLFLCHNTKILNQSMRRFRRIIGEKMRLAKFHGPDRGIDWNADKADMVFASFQKYNEWKYAFHEDEFDYIIVDESHHGQAPTFKEVISYFKPRELLGITATPDREDLKDIRDIFGPEIVDISLAEAITKGYLAKIEYHVMNDTLNYPRLRKILKDVLGKGKKISMKNLNRRIFVDHRDEEIVEKIRKFSGTTKKTMIFCQGIPHANNFQRFFPEAKTCHSGNPESERNLEDFREGKIQTIIAVNQLNEGVDIPDAEVIVFLRCTDSKTIFFQQLGRGLRKLINKEKVVILDFVANWQRVVVIKELANKVKELSDDDFVSQETILHVSGVNFDFIFDDKVLDILKVIQAIKKKFISDIPELLLEYSPKNELPPDQVTAGTNRKLWWKCSKLECRHEWQAAGSHRVIGTGCPACLGRAATSKNNLSVTHPGLAKEYIPPPKNKLPANQIIAGTAKKLWWKCSKPECRHEWLATGDGRVHGAGCPACTNKVVTSKNNLSVTHPGLAKEYIPPPKNKLPANQIIAGTNQKLWWKCSKPECGHEWQAMGNSRAQGSGCPACSGRDATSKNNLAATHPELAKEYMPPPKNKFPANKIVAGTNQKLWWKCSKPECGHEWLTAGNKRMFGTGCPACLRMVATSRNNLAVTHPELAKEYMPPPKNLLSTDKIIAGTKKKIWWKCIKEDCGHEWQAVGSSRAYNGTGCPACAGQTPTNKNNLAITHPELAKEYMPPPKNKLPANQIIAGTGKKVWWKCSKEDCGHEWQATGSHRAIGKTGCPACANLAITSKNNLAATHPELAKEYMPPPKNKFPANQIIAGTAKKLWWKCYKSECGHEWQISGDQRVRGSKCPTCARKNRRKK